jgi:hypothetical protein
METRSWSISTCERNGSRRGTSTADAVLFREFEQEKTFVRERRDATIESCL